MENDHQSTEFSSRLTEEDVLFKKEQLQEKRGSYINSLKQVVHPLYSNKYFMEYFCAFSPITIAILYFSYHHFCQKKRNTSYLIKTLKQYLSRYLREYSSKEKLKLQTQFYSLKRQIDSYIGEILKSRRAIIQIQMYLKNNRDFPIKILKNLSQLRRYNDIFNVDPLTKFIEYLELKVREIDNITLKNLEKIEKIEFLYKRDFRFFTNSDAYSVLKNGIDFTEDKELYSYAERLFSVIQFSEARFIPGEKRRKIETIFEDIIRHVKLIESLKQEVRREEKELERIRKRKLIEKAIGGHKRDEYRYTTKKLGSKVSSSDPVRPLRIKSVKAIAVLAIIIFAVITGAIILFKPHISYFHANNGDNIARAGERMTFSWEFFGNPHRAVLFLSDGHVKDVKSLMEEHQGKMRGKLNHTYALQGRYTPTLKIYNEMGMEYSKSFDLQIRNDPALFDIALNNEYETSRLTPLKSSDTILKVSEEEKVLISIENLKIPYSVCENQNLTYIYDLSEKVITTKNTSIMYSWNHAGTYLIRVSAVGSYGEISRENTQIEIVNREPQAFFSLEHKNITANKKIHLNGSFCEDTLYDRSSLKYYWDFGDATNAYGKSVSHKYCKAGTYTISLTVIDDNGASDTFSKTIKVVQDQHDKKEYSECGESNPYLKIGNIINEIFEDDYVQLRSEAIRKDLSLDGLTYWWNFGDGSHSDERHPKKAWIQTGIYDITLNVIDNNGILYEETKAVEVKEQAPKIIAKSFQAIESQSLLLNVEVYDSIQDTENLEFLWYNEKSEVISTDRKPVVVLEKGSYEYTLKVTDPSGYATKAVIPISIHSKIPEIYVSDYMYVGNAGNPLDFYFEDGIIEINAYGFDYEDSDNKFKYEWSIKGKDQTFHFSEYSSEGKSTYRFKCAKSFIYQGKVKISDTIGNSRTKSFKIYSRIVSSSEGIDELTMNLIHASRGEYDFDGDHLNNSEESYLNTDYLNPDSDGDGLYDGYNDAGVGEKLLGTDPTIPDTDFDGLEDGIEFFGYSITITFQHENETSFTVNSDPLLINSDKDNLNDYDEYMKGTNPQSDDTDADGIKDHLDPFPTYWDGDNDHLSDALEFEIGTHWNSSDSDNDALLDSEEYYGWGDGFRTDPLCRDSDHDFLSDKNEIMNYFINYEDEKGQATRTTLDHPISLFFPEYFTFSPSAIVRFGFSFGEHGITPSQQGEGSTTYGVADKDIPNMTVIIKKGDLTLFESSTNDTRYFSHSVDITEIMNNRRVNYHGYYTIELFNHNNIYPILDQFELELTRYLDPNNNDFDSDGLLDGEEKGRLVRGVEEIDVFENYETNETRIPLNSSQEEGREENGDFNEILLRIQDIGVVFDAILKLELESLIFPIKSVNIELQLIYDTLNMNEDEIALLNERISFAPMSQISYFKEFDLGNLISQDILPEFYGKYFLRIKINDPSNDLELYLSGFSIITDTYILASIEDKHAWITDPAKKSSDNDEWDDYHEIFVTNTNPVQEDSDLDGAWDPQDRDPHRDIIICVEPYYTSTFFDYGILQIVCYASFPGTELIGIKSSEQLTECGYVYFDEAFYFNINDNKNMNTIEFIIESYIGSPPTELDILGVSGTISYSIGSLNHQSYLSVNDDDTSTIIRVSTLAIERTNTIAIYDPDERDFVGHYLETERMNVIQLNLNDEISTEGTPFLTGPNAIVMPTSLFTETELNAFIEKERLSETELYSSVEGEFEFYSIDRSGNIIKAGAGDGDFVFVRQNINTNEAMEVLMLLLACLNETNDEIQVVYDYHSTKFNGTKASLLNLPLSTMKIIGWDCRYESSEEGPDPHPCDGWNPLGELFIFGILFLSVISFGTFPLVFAVGILVVEMGEQICQAIEEVMMNVLTFLKEMLWLVVRAALLVFTYVMLAIELMFISTQVLGIGVPMLTVSTFIDMKVNFKLNLAIGYAIETLAGFIQFETTSSSFRMESWIIWNYWTDFDLYIPWVEQRTINNEHCIINNSYSIIGTESSEHYRVPTREPQEDPVNPQLFNNNFNYECQNTYNFTVRYDDLNLEAPDETYGVKLHLIAPDGVALVAHQMDVVSTDLDYTQAGGILYDYELDTSIYNDGLWHYYFSTKDATTDKIIVFPEESYFVGPDTANVSYYLVSPHINTTATNYHDMDGWVYDEWTFNIHWWDMLDETSPKNVTLCLIPANISLGSGVSHRKGIQKFTMQFADSTPNWSNPVEYSYTLNFNDMGYQDDELGTFHYYFEAITKADKMTKSTQYEGPYVRSINRASIKLEITSSGMSESDMIPNILDSNSEILFKLEYSDPNSLPACDPPKLNLASEIQNYEFDFESYKNCSDGKIGWYVLSLSGSDIKAGRYNVSFVTPQGWSEEIKTNKISVLNNINFRERVIEQISSSFLLQGIIPLGLLAATGALALIDDSPKYRIMSIISLVGLIASETITLVKCLINDDEGGLLGFSLGNFLIQLIMMATITRDPEKLDGILKSLTYLSGFSNMLSSILMLSAISAGFFGDDILEDILYFADKILMMFVLGIPIAIAGLTINTLLYCCHKKGSSLTSRFKSLISYYITIYFVFSVVGFTTFAISLGLDW